MLQIEVEMNRKALYESISVFGAFVLFSAWVFQQAAVERANATLRRIDAAENQYRTYQSTNALFNAIIATRPQDSKVETEVRRFQTYNYGLGLEKLAEVSGVPPLIGYDVPMEEMETYLRKVQKRAMEIRGEIEQKRDWASLAFLLTYALGSVLVLVGNALKLRLSAGEAKQP